MALAGHQRIHQPCLGWPVHNGDRRERGLRVSESGLVLAGIGAALGLLFGLLLDQLIVAVVLGIVIGGAVGFMQTRVTNR